MKMLMIVFRESIVQHIHALLKEHQITSFSEIHNVEGQGETGPSVKSFFSPGANCMILTAVQEPAAARLIEAFTRFRETHGLHEHGNTFPLHVFALPCEKVV